MVAAMSCRCCSHITSHNQFRGHRTRSGMAGTRYIISGPKYSSPPAEHTSSIHVRKYRWAGALRPSRC